MGKKSDKGLQVPMLSPRNKHAHLLNTLSGILLGWVENVRGHFAENVQLESLSPITLQCTLLNRSIFKTKG